MEFKESVLFMEGFFNRRDEDEIRFRKLWTLMHDVNVERRDRIGNSISKMHRYWPINLDKKLMPTEMSIFTMTEAEMMQTFKDREKLG